LAQELSQAVLATQARIDEALNQAERERSAERQDLSQWSAAPVDQSKLEEMIQELPLESVASREEVQQLTVRRDEILSAHQQKLSETWRRLQTAYRACENRARHLQINREHHNAIKSFDRELRMAGIDDPDEATKAKVRSQFESGRFRGAAQRVRNQVVKELERAKQMIEVNAGLLAERNKLSDRRKEMEARLQETLSHLQQQHKPPGQDQLTLIADIIQAQAGVLKQLRRDILEPLLSEARLERSQGLGIDRLVELESLRHQAGA
jgi:hypothetical protein